MKNLAYLLFIVFVFAYNKPRKEDVPLYTASPKRLKTSPKDHPIC